MKACVVGSRALELDGSIAQAVLHELLNLRERGFTTIVMRMPLLQSVRPFESLTAVLSEVAGLAVEFQQPLPGGRQQVFLRDVEMVAYVDEVIAFFPEGSEMTGGTAHVVEKALDQAKPVRAYAMVDGVPVLIGSDNEDPSHDHSFS